MEKTGDTLQDTNFFKHTLCGAVVFDDEEECPNCETSQGEFILADITDPDVVETSKGYNEDLTFSAIESLSVSADSEVVYLLGNFDNQPGDTLGDIISTLSDYAFEHDGYIVVYESKTGVITVDCQLPSSYRTVAMMVDGDILAPDAKLLMRQSLAQLDRVRFP